jgi:hypothetical protein
MYTIKIIDKLMTTSPLENYAKKGRMAGLTRRGWDAL